MVFVRAFKAINEKETCLRYIDGHRNVLKDYGIESITSNNSNWINNTSVYCFVATNSNEDMIGGIRIQIADGVNRLPVETAIGRVDPYIYEVVNAFLLNGGVGELCGLWNSNKVKGMGISKILIRAAISTINQLKFTTLTGICAGYSLKMFQDVGFVINDQLGNNGNFVYPNENYIANVVGILNGISLDTALECERELMLTLRQNPIQNRIESGPKGNLKVNYNLYI